MTNFFKSLNPILNNEVNIIWIGFFLFILSVTNSWSSQAISSPDILKLYVASFGVTLLLIFYARAVALLLICCSAIFWPAFYTVGLFLTVE